MSSSGIPDAIAITNLLYRYAELIDAGDYEGIGEHLAHAVITAVASMPAVQWQMRAPAESPGNGDEYVRQLSAMLSPRAAVAPELSSE